MWIAAVWAWLKKWWRWAAAAVVLAAAFLLGVFTRRKCGGAPRADDPVGRGRDDAESAASTRVEAIHRAAAEREREVASQAEEERKRGTSDVAADTEVVKGDLEKTNAYLLGVGEEMKRP